METQSVKQEDINRGGCHMHDYNVNLDIVRVAENIKGGGLNEWQKTNSGCSHGNSP